MVLALIPFIGAGGFLGAVIGKFIGMKPYEVISAVVAGAFLSGLMYAYASEAIFTAFENYPWLTLIVVVIIVISIYATYKLTKRASAKIEEKEAAEKAEAA